MRILILLFLFIACNVELPKSEPAPAEVFKGRWNNAEYDAILANALAVHGKELYSVKPMDYKDFIKEWPSTKEGLTIFWSNILIEMSKYESGWKTATQYKESFKGSDGEYIISRGLYQLSHSSAKAYGCPLPKPESLHDPKLNIECAVVILNRWVGRDGRIAGKANGKWLGGARYWSVLRQEVGVPKKSTDAIKKVNQ
jgi:hypothetical protein